MKRLRTGVVFPQLLKTRGYLAPYVERTMQDITFKQRGQHTSL
jgi:hypothetical protein